MLQLGQEVLPATSVSFPPPIGGWNARDPLDGMPEVDAVRLENFFPNTQDIMLRRGFREHADGMGTGTIYTLAEYHKSDGTRDLIVGANSKLYEATTQGASATDITGTTTPTNDKWETVNFRDTLILVNGTDQPQQWNGSTMSDAAYTTVPDDSVFVDVTAYKNRLYFAEISSGSVWYGGVDAITGAVTEFDVQSLFNLGGSIQFITA